ncbi:phage tail spike protein [Micropruina sp.]|uniref:phage tail spike protein n=1 Tax=Micropruina sp. TaxID=2737536 RepID=UPI0039E3BC69
MLIDQPAVVALDAAGAPADVLPDVWDLKVITEINGEQTITWTMAANDPRAALIVNEALVQADGVRFRIKKVTTARESTDTPTIAVYGEATWYELAGKPRLVDREWTSSLAGPAVTAALVGTGWSVGLVTVTTSRSWTWSTGNPLEVLRQIQQVHGGDLTFDTQTKTVSLRPTQGEDLGLLFAAGRNVNTLRRIVDTSQLVTRMHAVTEDGYTFASINGGKDYVDNNTWTAEVIHGYLTYSESTGSGAMLALTQAALAEYAKPRTTYEAEVMDLSAIANDNLEDPHLGDEAIVFDEQIGIQAKHRIVRLEKDILEPWHTVVTLSSTLRNLGDGSDGGKFSGEDDPSAVKPKPPTGLNLSTAGYWYNGSPRSSVQATWSLVTEGISGYGIAIAYYSVRITGGRTARADNTTVGFDGLDPNQLVSVQVCAVSVDGVASDWTPAAQITTATPTADIEPPTPFTLSSQSGMITIAWDRMIQGGGIPYPPPLYLAHIQVQEGTSAAGPWIGAGAVTTAVPTLIRPHTDHIGETRWYRGRCVSTTGVEGSWGTTSSVVVTSAINTAVSDAQAAANAAAVAASNAQTTANGKNKIFTQMLSPIPADGLTVGDEWYVLNVSGQIIGVRIWNGGAWAARPFVADSVIVPSSVGPILLADGAVTAPKIVANEALINKIFTDELVASKVSGVMIQGDAIDGKTVTGAVVRTAASGARTQLDTNGLRVIDSGGNDLVRLGFSYPTGLAVRDPKTGGMLEASGMIFGSQFLTPNGHPRGWDTVAVNTPNYTRVGQYATAISSLSGRANLVAYVAIAGNSGGSELNSMDVMVQVHSVSNPASPTTNRLHAAQNPVSWTNLTVMNTETVILMEPADFGTAGNAYPVVWVRNRNSGSRSLQAWVGPIAVLPA